MSENPQRPFDVTCKCNFCNGHIQFNPADFVEGMTVQCPHCSMETILALPIPPVVSRPAPTVPPAVALPPSYDPATRRKRAVTYFGLWLLAAFVAGVGGLAFLSGAEMTTRTESAMQQTNAYILEAMGLICFVGAAIICALARVAETIRNRP